MLKFYRMDKLILGIIFLLFSIKAVAEDNFGYSWKKCERADLGNATIPFDKAGKFIPDCAPDILYSWQAKEKVLDLAKRSTPKDVLPVPHLYTWRTPLGTFGYGDVAIRIKLKADTQFALIGEFDRDCDRLPNPENTVYVAYLKGMFPEKGSTDASEYLICSSNVIESWSYGTEDLLKEMQREATWAEAHETYDFDRYSKSKQIEAGENCILRALNLDGKNNSLETLLRNFAEIIEMVKKSEGGVFYAAGVEHSLDRHLQTRIPSYFNPHQSNERPFSVKISENAPLPAIEQSHAGIELAAIRALRMLRKNKSIQYSVASSFKSGTLVSVYVAEKGSGCKYKVTYFDVTKPLPSKPRIDSFNSKCPTQLPQEVKEP